ncbi:NUDIX hydrolase [Pseudomonas coronafaciens]|uniref:NUDIX domain-containing protein n=1 Tax=Pseudomonas coronafaciens pv. coronafaciens TaxID=235275 RepID=A0AAE6UKX3_9PSED|nr:NUDIX hydrolase [Pseudomonas coronafaciens]QGT80935.1 NUDIX domain-containing protein [Pseudomonas coronafaciens pv. coronafaciens]RMS07884.1 NUDIX hydrolase [Pseudomonas coronafaciens pv. coronafaciens]
MNQVSPSDAHATRFPVSVKGVLILNRQVLLLKNERDEWELPGGKLEPDEDIPSCLSREIKEETGLDAEVTSVLSPYIYKVLGITAVLILPFKCRVKSFDSMTISHEHKEIGIFDIDRLDQINLPEGYKHAIKQSFDLN